MNPDPEDFTKIIQNAREALQRGDIETGTSLAHQAADLEPGSEIPWLLLAAVASPEDSLAYAQKALQLNPASSTAQKAFAWAQDRLPKGPVEEPLPDVGEPPTVDAETGSPADEPVSFDEVYQKLDEPAPVLEAETEPNADEPGVFDEEPELDVASWTFKTQPAAAEETLLPGMLPASLADSDAPAANAGKKNRLSPALILLFSVLLVLLIAVLAGLTFLKPRILSWLATPVPTPQCVEPSLMLGTTRYRIDSVALPANTFPEIPVDISDVAFWVEGTNIHYVFALSPTTNNLELVNLLKPGDPALIIWADCSHEEYMIRSYDFIQAGDRTLFDQSSGGLTVYVQTDPSTPILVFRAERPVIQPLETDATPPDSSTQLDIQIDYDQVAPDTGSIKIGLSLTNQGAKSVILGEKDLSLTVEGGAPVFPLLVEPALPLEILPGETITIAATFPKPQATIATLKILDITFDYYLQ